jgi:hypothetical protein
MKNKKRKGFASVDAPIFNEDDFLEYFESRVSEMIRNEVEQHFRDMLYKY